MINRNFFKIVILFIFVAITTLGISGCRSGNEIINEAKE